MDNISDICIVRETTVRQAMAVIDHSGIGLAIILDETGKFERTITDGDLRRLLLNGADMTSSVDQLPRIASIVVSTHTSPQESLEIMDANGISHLPVVASDGRLLDIIERKNINPRILLSTPHMGSAELGFIEDAFRTNWIAPLGPNVDAFEREMAQHVGAKHAAALSSGTAALHLALRLVNVSAGDRVFCSTFTFIASANPIIYQSAEPVFIDSEPDSWNMSPLALERALDIAKKDGRLPKAVIVVCLYGQSANMDVLLDICNQYKVPLIEDAAESLGATYKGKSSGTFGLLGIYSFNGNKIITTSGGGMLVSDDEDLIRRARFLSTQAREATVHYQHREVGYNYRMSNILAGVGRGQLQVLEERVLARRAVFETYAASFAQEEGFSWMPEPEWSYSTHWLAACTINPKILGVSSMQLIERLAGEMIEARPLWKPMHLQPVFEGCEYYSHANYSVSDQLFNEGICLPSGSNMSDNEIHRVIATMKSILDMETVN